MGQQSFATLMIEFNYVVTGLCSAVDQDAGATVAKGLDDLCRLRPRSPLEAPANPELDPPTAPRISQDELSVIKIRGRSAGMLDAVTAWGSATVC
jgi:hypothetical protein